MALHRLTTVTLGVPDPEGVAAFYEEFGLTRLTATDGVGGDDVIRMASACGGEQLRLVTRPHRSLVEIGVGVDDSDDLDRVEASLASLETDAPVIRATERSRLDTVEPVTGVRIAMTIAPRIVEPSPEPAAVNLLAHVERANVPADGVRRSDEVRPSKLSHLVLGSPDYEASTRFFVDGIGFAVSDAIDGLGSFMRCSEMHHNLLVQNAPVPFVHHVAWEVADVDEVGRGAAAMLARDPNRHIWGLGRHAIGSNFFWYLRDPSGTFAEYTSDLDRITDQELYQPEQWEGMQVLFAWAPPVPPSFIAPDDLGELMSA